MLTTLEPRRKGVACDGHICMRRKNPSEPSHTEASACLTVCQGRTTIAPIAGQCQGDSTQEGAIPCRGPSKRNDCLTGLGNPVVHDAVVVLENKRIAAVGPASQVPLPSGTAVLDVGNRTIMPGLIDAHVHILLSGSLSSGQESRAATESQALLMGVRNAQVALKSGLTTVRDCGDRDYLSLALRDFINHGDLAGPRVHLLRAGDHQYRRAIVVAQYRV